MKALSLTAGLLAAALGLSATSVLAADLDYGTVPPPDRYGSAYDDPRYRDLYGSEPRPSYTYAPRPYAQAPEGRVYDSPASGPVPPGYVYGGRQAYGGSYDRRADACLPKHEIKERLSAQGWYDFRDVDLRGDVARLEAQRRNGDLFRLKVDRCTGEVLNAALLERAGYGPYADRGAPPRYERRFY